MPKDQSDHLEDRHHIEIDDDIQDHLGLVGSPDLQSALVKNQEEIRGLLGLEEDPDPQKYAPGEGVQHPHELEEDQDLQKPETGQLLEIQGHFGLKQGRGLLKFNVVHLLEEDQDRLGL